MIKQLAVVCANLGASMYNAWRLQLSSIGMCLNVLENQCLNENQCFNASMLENQCFNASMLENQCFNASKLQCFNASMHQCFNASMHQCFNASMLQCFNAWKSMLDFQCFNASMLENQCFNAWKSMLENQCLNVLEYAWMCEGCAWMCTHYHMLFNQLVCYILKSICVV